MLFVCREEVYTGPVNQGGNKKRELSVEKKKTLFYVFKKKMRFNDVICSKVLSI